MKNPTNKTTTPNYDLAIIGGGPAGMTAAIYAGRANLKTVIFEKEAPGGKMIKTGNIENYPGFEGISGPDLAVKMYQQTSLQKTVKFIYQEVVKIEKRTSGKFTIYLHNNSQIIVKAVIIATGTQENKLNIPGEDEYTGHGVSYCAVCDGPFYRHQPVAIVGGGYSAITEGMYLAQFVSKLYVIVRKPHFKADRQSVAHLQNKKNVEFIMESEVIAAKGADRRLNAITIYNNQTHETYDLKVNALFPYIGAKPLTGIVNKFKIVNGEGYVAKFDDKLETTVPGLFVAGDVRTLPLRQIAIASGDGALSGQMAVEYIQNNF